MSMVVAALCCITVVMWIAYNIEGRQMHQYDKRLDKMSSRISELEDQVDQLEDIVYGVDDIE